MKAPEDKKTENLKVRITPIEREMLEAYCDENDIKMSEFIRAAVLKELRIQKRKEVKTNE